MMLFHLAFISLLLFKTLQSVAESVEHRLCMGKVRSSKRLLTKHHLLTKMYG